MVLLDLVAEAIKCNKHVVEELAKDKRIKPGPHRIPGEPNFDAGIPIGSIQQAYEYWSRNKKTLNLKIVRDFFKYVKQKCLTKPPVKSLSPVLNSNNFLENP